MASPFLRIYCGLFTPSQLSTARLLFFFFNDTATTEIYTLSLHDALPIYDNAILDMTRRRFDVPLLGCSSDQQWYVEPSDRKSTRLNSSHQIISYAVFCLKKKKRIDRQCQTD